MGLVLPDDYAVRLGPDDDVEIIDPGGSVILREGDGFHAGGGRGMGQLPPPCSERYPEVVIIGSAVHPLETP